MVDPIELEANDLAAMMSSKICHDLINPVAAINNGLQALADPAQAGMADVAQQMITNAAQQAQAKLEYARLAFGASSTQGTEFDTRECEKVANTLFATEKGDLDWQITPMLLPKNKAKLLMNLILIAIAAIPRGGLVRVKVTGEAGREQFEIVSTSDPEKKQRTLMPQGVPDMVLSMPEDGVDARSVQLYYTGLLARMTGMALTMGLEDTTFTATATIKD